MIFRSNIDPKVLQALVRYDPVTGELFWLPRTIDRFDGKWPERQMNAWNSRCAGKGAARQGNGRLSIKIFGETFFAHRVAWAVHYGSWPDGEIDHISGYATDNRLANLRCVTRQENNKNRGMATNNTSGVMGVNWYDRRKCWRAFIKISGKSQHLGHFKNFDDAVAARKLAETNLHFHANHGRAAA
jgi:HNH endonuclease